MPPTVRSETVPAGLLSTAAGTRICEFFQLDWFNARESSWDAVCLPPSSSSSSLSFVIVIGMDLSCTYYTTNVCVHL